MSDLMKRLKKASTIKETNVINKSKIYGAKRQFSTPVPMMNVAFSGSMDGGFQSGLTVFAGPSKHFKTMFALIAAKSFQDAFPNSKEDGIILFFDSEYGSPPEYFETLGLDTDRVLHIPIENVEQLRSELANILAETTKDDNVMIVVDSIGNLASSKETEDALNEKNVADMTRAKQIKSLFRIVTPQLTTKDVPMMVIAHTYDTMEMYSRKVVSGGTGTYYSANTIFILGRQQEKDGKEIAGYNFIINVEKSRFVKEGSKIPISVTFEGGVDQYSGLLDVALEGGYVVKPNQGWYQPANPETGEVLDDSKYRKADTNNKAFWQTVFTNTDFADYISRKYKIASKRLFSEQESDEEISSKPVEDMTQEEALDEITRLGQEMQPEDYE